MADSVDSGSKYGISDEYIDPWCDPCANDGKYARVVSYCPVCIEFFCKQCNQSHSNFQITKSHKVKRGTDMPKCQAEKPPKYEECEIHARGLKEYFCTDHNILICRECQKDHASCFVKHATVISKTLNNRDIKSFENDVTNVQKETSSTKYALECNIKNIEDKRKKMLHIAKKEHDEMKSKIAERFDSATNEINNKCDEEVSSLSSIMRDFSDGIGEYDSALHIIGKEDRTKLDTKLFIKLQPLVDNIRHTNTRLHTSSQAMKAIDLEFDVDSSWTSLLSSCPEIGNIQKKLSPSLTTIQLREIGFPPIKAEPFREITVTADSKNKTTFIGAFGVGNRFSTCCFGLTHEVGQDHFDQHVRTWKTSDADLKLSIPMTVLIAPDKTTLVAFGYEAENKYEELIQKHKQKDYFYFPNFGLSLREDFKKTDVGNLMIKDSSGKSVPVKTLYVLAVKFFCDNLLGTLQKNIPDLLAEDISWAITVPSFWTEAAKEFMKEAANEAGIHATIVCIVTEPQAAATFCRSMLKVGGKILSKANVTAGQKYLIMDVGEKESQITVDTLTPSVIPQLLFITSAGGLDESLIDDSLTTVFAEIVGDDVIQRFVKTKPDDWLFTKTSFRTAIIHLEDSHGHKVGFSVSGELLHLYKTIKGKTLKESIAANSELAADVNIIGNKMRIGSHFLRRFFDVPATKLILLLKSVLRNMEDERISTIFIIGEFTKSSELQNIVRSNFAGINFVFPTDPGLAVPKGAIIHGVYRMDE